MTRINSILLACALLSVTGSSPVAAQVVVPLNAPEQSYMVFIRSRAIGRESVAIGPIADGWVVRGSNRLGPPLDVVTRAVEITYDREWRPTRLSIEGTAKGEALTLRTTFANGQAVSQITSAGTTSSKTDSVAADTVVLPNVFLASYAALARRLMAQKPGATLHAYIAPQGEVPMRLDGVFAERIETPREAIPATRFALTISNPPPAGDLPLSVWADDKGGLLRMSIPSQAVDLVREDVASAVTRTTAFSLPGDESVRIPAAGFNLAASVARPTGAKGPLPALILIGGAESVDRDGVVAGIPVYGQMAADLVNAGFLVVRFDRRGVGQSGGRTETATITDYSDDVRAVITWLEKQRKDVDKRRIGLVGHSEGAWVALTVAARDKRVAAVALVAGGSTTGGELVLEQQRRLLDQLDTPASEKEAKIAQQKQINEAAAKGRGWEGMPASVRAAADTPWFQSFVTFDPARVMRDVRQPVLVVHGELDTQVAPHHADRLADLARARNRKVAVDVVRVAGVNHLMVPAKTGEVSEYATLAERQVSPLATTAIATWMAKNL